MSSLRKALASKLIAGVIAAGLAFFACAEAFHTHAGHHDEAAGSCPICQAVQVLSTAVHTPPVIMVARPWQPPLFQTPSAQPIFVERICLHSLVIHGPPSA
jgi:hypothetical protein